MVYDPAGIENLLKEGDTPTTSGTHALWVWTKADAKLKVTVGKQTFECVAVARADEDMTWQGLGEVELSAGKRFRVAITAERPYLDSRPDIIGRLVLSPDLDYDLSRSMTMTRVLGNRLGPVADARISLDRGTDTHFSFPGYRSLKEWETRAAELRQHILVSAGLWPMPERCPLNPRIFDRTEREDYTVEKVYFESYPGFFVTGNLYRPKGKDGPFPGLANPHGHWPDGRLADEEVGSVPGRCINFAKQGYVAFSYDMVGRNDSLQIPHDYQTEVADLWGVGLLGLQLWNSVRVVDFLQSLPDVDPDRIGCTGTSGGGTQTFMLMAIDERVKVAAPVCMVSGIMQGGCLCENSPTLRVDTYNAEIAALMAPRPLLLVAATGDWTRLNPEEEHPGIRTVYKLYGATDKVKCVRFDAPHNYNQDSREAVYQWFAKWLLKRRDHAKVKEIPFAAERRRDQLVFPEGSLPAVAAEAPEVVATIIREAERELTDSLPKGRKALAKFQQSAAAGLRHALAVSVPNRQDLKTTKLGRSDFRASTVERLVIGRKAVGDGIPAILFQAKGNAKGPGVVLVHPQGKAPFVCGANGAPSPLLETLLAAGTAVLAIDTFLTGEHHTPFDETQWDTSERHFWTFHRKAPAERVQDIITAAAYLRCRPGVAGVRVAGFAEAGLWALFAGAMDTAIDSLAADANNFANNNDDEWAAIFPVPSIRKVGDLTSAAALLAPRRLMIHNTGDRFGAKAFTGMYAAAKASRMLTAKKRPPTDAQIAVWLSQ